MSNETIEEHSEEIDDNQFILLYICPMCRWVTGDYTDCTLCMEKKA